MAEYIHIRTFVYIYLYIPHYWLYWSIVINIKICFLLYIYINFITVYSPPNWLLKNLSGSKPPTNQLFLPQFVCAHNNGYIKAPHYRPFVRTIHQYPVDSLHKWPIMWKTFASHDVLMRVKLVGAGPRHHKHIPCVLCLTYIYIYICIYNIWFLWICITYICNTDEEQIHQVVNHGLNLLIESFVPFMIASS